MAAAGLDIGVCGQLLRHAHKHVHGESFTMHTGCWAPVRAGFVAQFIWELHISLCMRSCVVVALGSGPVSRGAAFRAIAPSFQHTGPPALPEPDGHGIRASGMARPRKPQGGTWHSSPGQMPAPRKRTVNTRQHLAPASGGGAFSGRRMRVVWSPGLYLSRGRCGRSRSKDRLGYCAALHIDARMPTDCGTRCKVSA